MVGSLEKGTKVDVDDLDFSNEKVDFSWSEAEFQCMDVDEEHWNNDVLKWLTSSFPWR